MHACVPSTLEEAGGSPQVWASLGYIDISRTARATYIDLIYKIEREKKGRRGGVKEGKKKERGEKEEKNSARKQF